MSSTKQSDEWGDSCDSSQTVPGTGTYTGTLESEDDADYFRVQLDHGEYLEIDAFAPIEADNPEVTISGDYFTARNGENLDLDPGAYAYVSLEPGIEGSFELWAETTQIICFAVEDSGPGGGFPYDWELDLQKQDAGPPDDSWGDSCDTGPVVDPTGIYDGTLVSPDDQHCLRVQLDHGEYLEIDAFAPIKADNPEVIISGDYFTARNGENLDLDPGAYAYVSLEPGIEGSFELWAETTQTICFAVEDSGPGGGFPYDWELDLQKQDAGPPDDSWGDSCDTGPVVDPTGIYDGTLVSPDDQHCLRVQLDHGEYLEIDAFAPIGADNPEVTISGDYFTARNGENLDLDPGVYAGVSLEPGIEGSFELWAETTQTICFAVEDSGPGGGFPYDWELNLQKQDAGPPDDSWGDSCDTGPVVDPTGIYDGTLVSPDDQHYLRIQLNQDEMIEINAFVPGSGDNPRVSFSGDDYTLSDGENLDYLGSFDVGLIPGTVGSFVLNSNTTQTICFEVEDSGRGGSFPYTWQLSLDENLEPPDSGTISGTVTDLAGDPLADVEITFTKQE